MLFLIIKETVRQLQYCLQQDWHGVSSFKKIISGQLQKTEKEKKCIH